MKPQPFPISMIAPTSGLPKWSSASWSPQQHGSTLPSLRELRLQGRKAGQERSLLCPGFMVPPYIAWKLSRAERSMLRRNVLGAHSVVETELRRPIRIFFENGLELRITASASLEMRAIYHVHPWLIHRRPPGARMRLGRPPFEGREETFSTSFGAWSESDPALSNHEKMQILAQRRSQDEVQFECFDATLALQIMISAVDRTIFIDRPEGCGLVIRHTPIGRRRLHEVGRSQVPTPRAKNMHDRLRSAAVHCDGCISTLPWSRRIALVMSADVAPFVRLVEDGLAALTGRIGRLRKPGKAPSPHFKNPGNPS